MGAATDLSPRLVETRLRALTERLAVELDAPSPTAPGWGDLEWRLARAAAAIHGISPLLQTSLPWRGPAAWEDFLRDQRVHTYRRHERIAMLLERIDAQARRDGLSLMALKGAALHARGYYAAGERPMADVDLLVPADRAEAVARMLSSLGYRDAGVTWKHRSFAPACDAGSCVPGEHAALGEHAERAVKIDLHTRIAERLPLAPVDFTDLLVPARWRAGLNGYPSLAALMLHVLAHAAGTMVSRGVRLIQLVDVARLARAMSTADWDELFGRAGTTERLWWAYAPLALTARYFRSAVPSPVLERLAERTPWLLRRAGARRRLSDVSYAHVFIDPIPGLLWGRSAGEMARYVLSRIRPSREQLAQLDLLGRTGPWSGAQDWYGQSQGRRIWRWLTSRPTRIETMLPVRAALAE